MHLNHRNPSRLQQSFYYTPKHLFSLPSVDHWKRQGKEEEEEEVINRDDFSWLKFSYVSSTVHKRINRRNTFKQDHKSTNTLFHDTFFTRAAAALAYNILKNIQPTDNDDDFLPRKFLKEFSKYYSSASFLIQGLNSYCGGQSKVQRSPEISVRTLGLYDWKWESFCGEDVVMFQLLYNSVCYNVVGRRGWGKVRNNGGENGYWNFISQFPRIPCYLYSCSTANDRMMDRESWKKKNYYKKFPVQIRSYVTIGWEDPYL